jgi:chorismate-pyruvate lyase
MEAQQTALATKFTTLKDELKAELPDLMVERITTLVEAKVDEKVQPIVEKLAAVQQELSNLEQQFEAYRYFQQNQRRVQLQITFAKDKVANPSREAALAHAVQLLQDLGYDSTQPGKFLQGIRVAEYKLTGPRNPDTLPASYRAALLPAETPVYKVYFTVPSLADAELLTRGSRTDQARAKHLPIGEVLTRQEAENKRLIQDSPSWREAKREQPTLWLFDRCRVGAGAAAVWWDVRKARQLDAARAH